MTSEAATRNAKDDLHLVKWCRTHFIEVSILTVFASAGLFLLFGFCWLCCVCLFVCLNMVEKGVRTKVKKGSVRIKVLCMLVILVIMFAHAIYRMTP